MSKYALIAINLACVVIGALFAHLVFGATVRLDWAVAGAVIMAALTAQDVHRGKM